VTAILLAIGVAAGVLSGLFGIGGGIVIVPALLLFARMPPLTATGTSLGALLIPVGALVGAWQYHRTGNLDIRASVLIALGMVAGAWLGARAAQHVSGVVLQRAFAVLLVVVAIRVWLAAK
jgi:uncharacterized membrane protein YfcA